MRRLAIAAVVLALLIFGVEFTLSTLRTRTIAISFETALKFTPTPLPPEVPTLTPTRTPDPRKEQPTATATPLIPFLAPGDAMIVNARWDYRIGPRFQRVTIKASARIPDREQPVAENSAVIDCGSELFNCMGTVAIALNYQLPDASAQGGLRAIPWPLGEYTVTVEQSAGGLKYTELQKVVFRVRAQ